MIGVPDSEWGQRVVAVIQPAPGVTGDDELAAELIEHCARELASFKCPRQVEFVSDFPRTETGKVQRRVLRDTPHLPRRQVRDALASVEESDSRDGFRELEVRELALETDGPVATITLSRRKAQRAQCGAHGGL